MKQKDFILFLFFLTIPLVKTFATAQIGDRLIYNGDTLILFSNPLEEYLSNKPQRTINEYELTWTSTACYRGYIATWEIDNDSLFLLKVQKGCQSENLQYFDLANEFGTSRVFANWYTGKALAPKGELLFYVHDAYESLYESEIEFQIDKGQVIGIKTYDNSKSKQSVYSQNDEKLRQFIYSNINWEVLPTFKDNEINVFIQFSANENGIIDSVKVLRGYNSIFDNEAIRIVKAIPEWDIYYKHGNNKRITWNLPIVFSERNKNEYFKKRNKKE